MVDGPFRGYHWAGPQAKVGPTDDPRRIQLKRLLPFLLLPLLAACDPAMIGQMPVSTGTEAPEPPPPPTLPPAAAAVLPPGTPPSVVLTDNDGCYLYSIEVTNPPSGFPLRDAAGNRICEDGVRADPPAVPPAPAPGQA
jgi:hypothetical protein